MTCIKNISSCVILQGVNNYLGTLILPFNTTNTSVSSHMYKCLINRYVHTFNIHIKVNILFQFETSYDSMQGFGSNT
jgi:hypothetical protein